MDDQDTLECTTAPVAKKQRTDQIIESFVCTYDGCERSFSRKNNMDRHVNTVHYKIRDVTCSWSDCEKTFSTKADMERHVKAVHQGVKNIRCLECSLVFSTKGNMNRHVKTVHDGVINISCSHSDCQQMFSNKENMLRHVKTVHEGVKDICCSDSDCNQMFYNKTDMKRHVKSVHHGIKDIECSDPDCNKMFSNNSEMKQHYQSWHTKEGMQKKMKKQDRVATVLRKRFAVDAECHIQYKNGCVPDPDKFYSRLDFHVLGLTEYIVIVECDEHGHADYELSCEQSRMEQTSEAIHVAQANKQCPPIVFIRYNCDKATMDGDKIDNRRRDRENALMKYLENVYNGEIIFSNPLNLVYINYDAITNEDGSFTAEVMLDPEFVMQGAVKDVICVH